jgi:hypothetical protein
MRRTALRVSLLAALAAGLSIAVPSTQAAPHSPLTYTAPGPGGFTSPNVTYIGSIPTGVGVSARVVTVDGQRRLYMSSAHSLTIYDITDPSLPVPMGVLPIYNWENEDIAVSKDGNTAILTEFESSFYLHVVDTTNPRLPVLKGSILFDGSHTVECADVHCNYLFASNGKTYDLRDRSNPVALPRAKWWSTQAGAGSAHALHQDLAGYWIADETPLVMFKATDPLHITRVTTGPITKKTAYQHNNVRPAANKYVPRKPGDDSKRLRLGELLMGEGETNFSPACDGTNGAFATWSMVGWDKGKPMKQLHVLRPVNGDYADGNAAVNALGCSGHWFSVRTHHVAPYRGSYIVAGAWYEHGTRFLAVDRKTATIRQIGYFQPVRGSASAAYWIRGTNYVYVVDYQRGLDILKFSPWAPAPTAAETTKSWLAKLHTVDTMSQQMRFWCRQAMEQEA